MDLGIVEIILMTSLVNSMFFLILIYVSPKRYNQANRALTFFIFLTSLNFASWILIPYLAYDYDWFCIDRFPVVYFLGPLIYAFSQALFGTNGKQVIKHKHLIGGYLDILLTMILWGYIYFFAIDDKFEILFDPLTLHIYEGIAIFYNGFYLYRAIRIALNGPSNLSRLVHVFVIIVIIFLLWIGLFLADVSVYPAQLPDTAFYPLWLLMLYLNLYLGYHFIMHPIKPIAYMIADKKPPSVRTTDLAAHLENLMEEEKLFKKPDLSLAVIAGQMNASTHALTLVLKEHFKCSYYDFVNDYRVADTIERFKMGDDRQYTIKTIAEEAGFRSKTTFIKAFRKKTGMLPKEFISSVRVP
ncbi:MAG: helix-turn-helix transcriptional regulator [Reichenbachiella sp.]|uniref:helix-turn-helix domain-containing protein n=1 Tax=Reichenbachiella sp. TaxID=2184521 RepID=UPI0032663E7E